MAIFTLRTGLSNLPPTPLRRHTALAGMGLFYLAAMLLNASSLQRELDLIKYGRQHDVSVALIKPVAELSHMLSLDKPRQWLEQSIGAWLQNAKMGS